MVSPPSQRLMATDPMELTDYRRLVGALDDVVGLATVQELGERLPAIVARHFGWCAAVVIDGPTWPDDGTKGELAGALAELARELPGTVRLLACKHTERAGHPHTVVELRTRDDRRGWRRSERARPHQARDDTIAVRIADTRSRSLYTALPQIDGRAGLRQREILCKLGRHLVTRSKRPPLAVVSDAQRWSLTQRERQVVELVTCGLTNEQIARRLHISTATVKKHLTHAMGKTDCASRTQLAILWQTSHAP